jgi:hypothetical protein
MNESMLCEYCMHTSTQTTFDEHTRILCIQKHSRHPRIDIINRHIFASIHTSNRHIFTSIGRSGRKFAPLTHLSRPPRRPSPPPRILLVLWIPSSLSLPLSPSLSLSRPQQQPFLLRQTLHVSLTPSPDGLFQMAMKSLLDTHATLPSQLCSKVVKDAYYSRVMCFVLYISLEKKFVVSGSKHDRLLFMKNEKAKLKFSVTIVSVMIVVHHVLHVKCRGG